MTTDATGLMAWAEVDLDAIEACARALRAMVPAHCRYYSVIKADAYGHGAVEVARKLAGAGIADAFCVARATEAEELRAACISQPILLLGAPPALGHGALPPRTAVTVSTPEHLEIVAGAAGANPVPIHLKTDVGMGRLGCPPGEAMDMLRHIHAEPRVLLEGVYGHLPCADNGREEPTGSQIERFAALRRELGPKCGHETVFHLANSAATMDFPSAHFDAVRIGIAQYGLRPSADVLKCPPLRPAMALKARVAQVKTVPSGTGLSYGHSFVTERETRVATVTLGYADGYPRQAGKKGAMLVNGVRAPIAGKICMDLILLDVTDCGEVRPYDEAIAFGEALSAEEVGAAAGTINYEIVTRVGKRVMRVYRGA